MNNLEIEKLKTNVANFINEINTMKSNVNTLINQLSNSNDEIITVKNKIEQLKRLTTILTLDSSIKDFLTITSLMEEINKMIFDFDYVIDPDEPNIIIPTIEKIITSVDEDFSISAQASVITDPQLRLRNVTYTLLDDEKHLVEEINLSSALNKAKFKPVKLGVYTINGNFTYEDNNTEILSFDLISTPIEIKDEDIICPIIEKISISLEDNIITAQAIIGSDPQSRLKNVQYSIYTQESVLIEQMPKVSSVAPVSFSPISTSGNYAVHGEFTFQDTDSEGVISKNSELIRIDIKDDTEVATVKFGASNTWSNGFSGTLEIISQTNENFGGDWELTFDTALNDFDNWQLKTEKNSNSMRLSSALDWSGTPCINLPPQGTISLRDISANGAPMNDSLITNCKLNGKPVILYIDGKLIDGGGDTVEFPSKSPILGALTVGTINISNDKTKIIGSVNITSKPIYNRYAIYLNKNKIREEECLVTDPSNIIIDIDISSLPLINGENTISLAFCSELENTVSFYETNLVSVIKTYSDKSLIGYWSSWGGNGPTSYIDLEDIPTEYKTVLVSFIQSEADQITPKFDPSDSGRVTKDEFKEKVKKMQDRGHKIIISIGGQNGIFKLNSSNDKNNFKIGIIQIIQEYGFDGYDIDLEGGSIGGAGDYTHMLQATKEIVEYFRSSNENFIYSLAPEVAYLITRGYGTFYINLIKEQSDLISYIQPQYYNAPGTGVFKHDNSGKMVCSSNTIQEQQEFIREFTHSLILGHDGAGWGSNPAQTFPVGPIPENKLIIGLPAGTGAAGTGAIDDMEAIKKSWEEIISLNFTDVKGFMTWSIDWDKYHNWQFKTMAKETLGV